MSDDRRLEPRYALSVPIRIGDVQATTVDLSTAGVAFVSPVPFTTEETIAFSVTLKCTGVPVQMDCRGTVTRTEACRGAFLVAATIDHFRIATDTTSAAQSARVSSH
jgi:hypothetical protein